MLEEEGGDVPLKVEAFGGLALESVDMVSVGSMGTCGWGMMKHGWNEEVGRYKPFPRPGERFASLLTGREGFDCGHVCSREAWTSEEAEFDTQ